MDLLSKGIFWVLAFAVISLVDVFLGNFEGQAALGAVHIRLGERGLAER